MEEEMLNGQSPAQCTSRLGRSGVEILTVCVSIDQVRTDGTLLPLLH